jgi:hypothetical protein
MYLLTTSPTEYLAACGHFELVKWPGGIFLRIFSSVTCRIFNGSELPVQVDSVNFRRGLARTLSSQLALGRPASYRIVAPAVLVVPATAYAGSKELQMGGVVSKAAVLS